MIIVVSLVVINILTLVILVMMFILSFVHDPLPLPVTRKHFFKIFSKFLISRKF